MKTFTAAEVAELMDFSGWVSWVAWLGRRPNEEDASKWAAAQAGWSAPPPRAFGGSSQQAWTGWGSWGLLSAQGLWGCSPGRLDRTPNCKGLSKGD